MKEATRRATKQHKKTNCFQRGFLLSNEENPSIAKWKASPKSSSSLPIAELASNNKSTTKVSSDLLMFEGDNEEITPFRIVSETENNSAQQQTTSEDQPRLPLDLSLEETEDDFRIEPISTTTRTKRKDDSSPMLIQDVTHDLTRIQNTNASRREPLQRQEVLTNKQGTKIEEGLHAPSPQEEKESIPIQETSTATPLRNEKRINQSMSGSIPLQEPDGLDLSLLGMELSRVLWRLKKQESKSCVIARDFATTHLGSSLPKFVYVWDSILEACAEQGDSAPELRLGMAVLQYSTEGISSLASFLDPKTEDKRLRLIALGSVLVVRYWLNNGFDKYDSNVQNLVDLLAMVVPKLTYIVLEIAPRKTVLSHHSMGVAYEILTVASKAACQTNDSALLQSLYKTITMVEKLCKVQQTRLDGTLGGHDLAATPVSPDVTRKQCIAAVLADWIRLIKYCLKQYQDLCLENDKTAVTREKALLSVTRYWSEQVSGVRLDGTAHVDVGSLSQTLGDRRLDPSNVLSSLDAAVGLTQVLKEDSHPEQQHETIQDRQRALLRGVVAWLGQSKKHTRLLAKTASVSNESSPSLDAKQSTMLQRATELTMNLLWSNTEESTNLVLAALNHLWSDLEGLPPDFFDDSDASNAYDAVPPSFGVMMDELKSATSGTHNVTGSARLDTSTRALCLLISRCVVRKGKRLLEALVSRNGLVDSTVEVLAMVVSAEELSTSVSDSKELQFTGERSVRHEAGRILLDNIRKNASVRKKLLDSPALLARVPMELSVPKLIQILMEELSSTTRANIDSVVGSCLTHVLKANFTQVSKMVSVLVDSLLQATGRGSHDKTKGQKDPVARVCANFGGGWRRALLTNPCFGDNGFSEVLVAIGRAMFSMPSSSEPLTLLGAVVGDGTGLQEASEIERRRVYNATLALVDLSLKALETVSLPENGVDVSKEGDTGLFRRLSPLLLLRRIPSSYFRVLYETGDKTGDDKVSVSLEELSKKLEQRLEVGCDETTTFTAEERRLSAELAGRCLPFYVESTCYPSCFGRICIPTFCRLLSVLTIDSNASHERKEQTTRTARAALYATCHHVPIAHDTDHGNGLLETASFGLRVLTLETLDEDKDMIQLQTGCIDFFAICHESLLQQSRKQNSDSASAALVAEVAACTEKGDGNEATSTMEALIEISNTLVGILRTGKSCVGWIHYCDKRFGGTTAPSMEMSYSPSTRTCLWNSLLLTSQRITEQDGMLDRWARRTCPWILEWEGPVDLNLRHPLCTAAALQLTFALITRTKSFECLSNNNANQGIRKAYKWALESIKSNYRDAGDYAAGAMRMAALKLMLAIVTLDQYTQESTSWQGCLSPGELGESFSILQGAANMDTDQNVRKLATHILGAMQLSVG